MNLINNTFPQFKINFFHNIIIKNAISDCSQNDFEMKKKNRFFQPTALQEENDKKNHENCITTHQIK